MRAAPKPQFARHRRCRRPGYADHPALQLWHDGQAEGRDHHADQRLLRLAESRARHEHDRRARSSCATCRCSTRPACSARRARRCCSAARVLDQPEVRSGARRTRAWPIPSSAISHYFCVTQMAMMMRQLPGFDGRRLSHLTALITGGAPNPEAHILRWLDDGVMMVNGWGMSEICSALAQPVGDIDRIRAHPSAGRPAAHDGRDEAGRRGRQRSPRRRRARRNLDARLRTSRRATGAGRN